MADKTFDQMSFFDFLAVARRHLDQLEACYTSGIAGDGHVEEFAELHKDAGWALALAGSRGTADLRDIEAASELAFTPEDVDGLPAELVAVLTGGADLWEVAEADDDPVGAAPDPAREARCERSIAAADDGLMGIFSATAEIAFRGTHVIPATEGDPVATLFSFTDVDGDLLAAFTADIPGVGKGINIRTSKNGCSIPDEVAVKMAAAILRKVVGPVHEFPEELAAEVVRLREESARAYSQGVEDMREAAVKALLAEDTAEWALAGQHAGKDAARIVRDVTLTSPSGDIPAPSLEERVRELEDLTEAMSAELEAHSRALDGK